MLLRQKKKKSFLLNCACQCKNAEHQFGMNNQLKPLIFSSWDYLNLCYGHFVMVYILGNRHDHIPIFMFPYVSVRMQHSHIYDAKEKIAPFSFFWISQPKVIHLWSQYARNACLKLGAMLCLNKKLCRSTSQLFMTDSLHGLRSSMLETFRLLIFLLCRDLE